jgi:hypothetical protein
VPIVSINRLWAVVEVKHEEAGRRADIPLRKAAVIAVVKNPCAGRYVEDLMPMIEASRSIGEDMACHLKQAVAFDEIQSYGKGGLVGLGGEQEHANALLTSTFAAPFRELIGDSTAWISSMTKVGAPGTLIDIPMNAKTDVYVRSHYDGMSCVIADAPRSDEIVLFFCVATRGRLNARVGGLTYEDARDDQAKPRHI